MLRRILPLALALILTALPALGQFNGRGGTNAPAGSSLSLGGGTVSGQVTIGATQNPMQIVINPNCVQNGPYCFGEYTTYDTHTNGGGSSDRWAGINATIQPSGTPTDTWEQFFLETTLTDPSGYTSGEINQVHPYFTMTAGSSDSSNVENFEASSEWFGAMTGAYSPYLSQEHIASTGTMFLMQSFYGNVVNDNPTAGSFNTYVDLLVPIITLTATATTSTVTFTNSSASIGWASNTLTAEQAVSFTTTGGLPTGFATGTTYYVLSTGLTSSTFEVSLRKDGLPITAGSAGSGTQTATLLGAPPTFDFAMKVTDLNGLIATVGPTTLGSGAVPSNNSMLSIYGADNTTSTYAYSAYNCTTNCGKLNPGGTLISYLRDDGDQFLYNTLIVGSAGTNAGTVEICSATSGECVALKSGATTSGVATPITIPQGTTTTLAGLAVAQTFTAANTFSSTLNLTGLASDSGQSDATVCDVTGTGKIYYGSGTGGICLSTSSARFKMDIASEREGLTQLMALHPVGFNYRPGHGYDPAKRYNGFIAEQMAPVLPELVGHDDAGLPNSVDLMGLVPILVRSVQQQQWEIRALAAVCLLLALWCSGLTVVLVRRR